VLVETADTSTISSRAVSGSITTVKISPAEIVTPPSREVPDTTVAEVAELVNAADSVVCCERDEYLRVVIYLPIGCSGLGLDTVAVVLLFPLPSVVYIVQRVVLLHFQMNQMDALNLSHLLVG
jgi:hypothetical protein